MCPSEDMNEMAYHPDMKPKEGGLYCFKDQARPCGPDCMAFLTYVPEGNDYRGQQWAHCSILMNQHRSSKHLVVIANGINALLNAQADAVRTQQTPPTVPGAVVKVRV